MGRGGNSGNSDQVASRADNVLAAVNQKAAPGSDAYDALLNDNQEWLSGWSDSHDYDPTWDYHVVIEYKDHQLLADAQRFAERLITDEKMPNAGKTLADVPVVAVRVFPADLSHMGGAALYISGTGSEAVILVDIDAHVRAAKEEFVEDGFTTASQIAVDTIFQSIKHEMRHAVQDTNGFDMDEDEAEYGSDRLPF